MSASPLLLLSGIILLLPLVLCSTSSFLEIEKCVYTPVPVASVTTSGQGHLTIHNKLSFGVAVYWMGKNGEEVEMQKSLGPGDSFGVNTFSGHAWRIRKLGDPIVVLQGQVQFPLSTTPERLVVEVVDSCDVQVQLATAVEDRHWRETSPEAEIGSAALASCRLDHVLGEVGSPGFHVLCPLPVWEEGGAAAGGEKKRKAGFVRFCAFMHGVTSPRCTASFVVDTSGGEDGKHCIARSSSSVSDNNNSNSNSNNDNNCNNQTVHSLSSIAELIKVTMLELRLQKLSPRHPAPAMYSRNGQRVAGLLDDRVVNLEGGLLFFIGGHWLWPTVRIGYEQRVDDLIYVPPPEALLPKDIESLEKSHYNSTQPIYRREVILRTLAHQPRLFEVVNLLDPYECDEFLDKAGELVARSSVMRKDKDSPDIEVETWRKSKTHFLNSADNPIIEGVELKVERLTRVPLLNAEDAQVLRYDIDGMYSFHHDYFDPKDYQQGEFARELEGGAKNRLVNTFMYLSDVEEGGETGFPRAGGLPTPPNYEDCNVGILSKPIKGKVVVFYMMNPDGSLDPFSLHGGCKVRKGVKWSANFWQWNKARKDRNVFHGLADLELLATLPLPAPSILPPLSPSSHASSSRKDEL